MRNDEARQAQGSRTARTAAITAGVLLAAIAALHGLWAVGITWPFGDKEALSQTVFGSPASTFPPPVATLAVTVLLGGAALVVTGRAGVWGGWMPRWVFTAGTWAVATVLLLRAALYGPAAIGSDDINRTWELALFTPLCILLGLLCVVVARSDARSRRLSPMP
jgi:hypothetical protein